MLEQFCGVCERQNYYRVAKIPVEDARGLPPTDDMFQRYPQITEIQEESECCCRACCGPMRELKLFMRDTTAGTSWTLDRPFRCTFCLPCLPCFMCCPQEATLVGYGKAIQDWGPERFFQFCLFGECYTRLEDIAGTPVYYLRQTYPTLCNCYKNCFAPSCFNESK